jgi:D-alanyl-D-alanine carboxypeptidase
MIRAQGGADAQCLPNPADRYSCFLIPWKVTVNRFCKVLAAGLALSIIPVTTASASAAPVGQQAPAAGQSPGHFSPATVRAITSIVLSGAGSAGIPGTSVGIWVPGRGRYVRTFGAADVATGRPVTLADHFRIASITKTFTATVILQLADQKKLSLSDHLSRFVKGIRYGSRITVSELLGMRSGIYDYTSDPAFLKAYTKNPDLRFTARDFLRIVRRHAPLFRPGTQTAYDDSNYFLLGLIARTVTHRPLGQLIRTQILAPLHLAQTSYPASATIPAPAARGYLTRPDGSLRDMTRSNPAVAAGAGAMISPLGNLKIWAKALATGALLRPATQRRRLRTHLLSKAHGITLSYGLGIGDLNGFLGHNGAIFGYTSAMFYLPKRDATIVVLGNNSGLSSTTTTAIFVALAAYLFPQQFPGGIG